MNVHPVLDQAEILHVLDAASYEELTRALLRRSERTLAIAEAALHEAQHATVTGRVRELHLRCASTARSCKSFADAVHALAPDHEMDRQAAGFARVAANFAQLAIDRLCQVEALEPVQEVRHG